MNIKKYASLGILSLLVLVMGIGNAFAAPGIVRVNLKMMHSDGTPVEAGTLVEIKTPTALALVGFVGKTTSNDGMIQINEKNGQLEVGATYVVTATTPSGFVGKSDVFTAKLSPPETDIAANEVTVIVQKPRVTTFFDGDQVLTVVEIIAFDAVTGRGVSDAIVTAFTNAGITEKAMTNDAGMVKMSLAGSKAEFIFTARGYNDAKFGPLALTPGKVANVAVKLVPNATDITAPIAPNPSTPASMLEIAVYDAVTGKGIVNAIVTTYSNNGKVQKVTTDANGMVKVKLVGEKAEFTVMAKGYAEAKVTPFALVSGKITNVAVKLTPISDRAPSDITTVTPVITVFPFPKVPAADVMPHDTKPQITRAFIKALIAQLQALITQLELRAKLLVQ